MRQSSYIKLNRAIIEYYGHFPAMVADCVKHQIEYHIAAELDDNRFMRQVNGLVYVNTPGQFIANWLMCNKSTVTKNVQRLIVGDPSKEIPPLMHQDFFTGNNGGSWLAFLPDFIGGSSDFFDSSVRKLLISIYETESKKGSETPDSSPVNNLADGGDNITGGGDDSTGGGDDSTGGGDDSTGAPIIDTNPHNQHPKGVGFVDMSFLNESDARFKGEISAILERYDKSQPVEMVKAALGWKKCADRSARKINDMCSAFGFPILCAAAVFAFHEDDLQSPLRFLETVCQRLLSQHAGNLQRRNMARAGSRPPNPKQRSLP